VTDQPDNVTTLPNEQRLAEIREAAELYLQRADLPICVENKPYVRELAALLGSPEGWSAFATAARVAYTALNIQTPTRTSMMDYLKDMKSAVLKALREDSERAEFFRNFAPFAGVLTNTERRPLILECSFSH
jgi:hypothetical protein